MRTTNVLLINFIFEHLEVPKRKNVIAMDTFFQVRQFRRVDKRVIFVKALLFVSDFYLGHYLKDFNSLIIPAPCLCLQWRFLKASTVRVGKRCRINVLIHFIGISGSHFFFFPVLTCPVTTSLNPFNLVSSSSKVTMSTFL